MGLVYANIENSMPIETQCLVDTGALHLCIPKHIQIQ